MEVAMQRGTLALVAALVLVSALPACREKGPAEKVGEAIDDVSRETGDTLEDAADKMEDALDKK
jgi:predicted small lipoprotein YifL